MFTSIKRYECNTRYIWWVYTSTTTGFFVADQEEGEEEEELVADDILEGIATEEDVLVLLQSNN